MTVPGGRGEPIVLRRRRVRPLVGFRERVAILLAIGACALALQVGSELAEGVARVMTFDVPAEAGLVEAPGG